MPIKKRAKRSPTPTSNSAAPPASQFPCDKQPRVSQGTDPSDVNNSDARLESFGPTTSSALSNQATPGMSLYVCFLCNSALKMPVICGYDMDFNYN